MRPERRPSGRNGGAAQAALPATFWRESAKSQGFGDRVPKGIFGIIGSPRPIASALMPEVVGLGPHFCPRRDIIFAKIAQQNGDFVLWIGAQQLKAADGRRYFHTVRALEQERIANLETFAADRYNAGNENKSSILNRERVGDGEEVSLYQCPL